MEGRGGQGRGGAGRREEAGGFGSRPHTHYLTTGRGVRTLVFAVRVVAVLPRVPPRPFAAPGLS